MVKRVALVLHLYYTNMLGFRGERYKQVLGRRQNYNIYLNAVI